MRGEFLKSTLIISEERVNLIRGIRANGSCIAYRTFSAASKESIVAPVKITMKEGKIAIPLVIRIRFQWGQSKLMKPLMMVCEE